MLQPRPQAQLCDPQQPEDGGKPLRRIDRMSAVLLGNISSFVQKLEDRMTGSVELSVVVSRTLSRSRKWYHFGTHC